MFNPPASEASKGCSKFNWKKKSTYPRIWCQRICPFVCDKLISEYPWIPLLGLGLKNHTYAFFRSPLYRQGTFSKDLYNQVSQLQKRKLCNKTFFNILKSFIGTNNLNSFTGVKNLNLSNYYNQQLSGKNKFFFLSNMFKANKFVITVKHKKIPSVHVVEFIIKIRWLSSKISIRQC